MEYWGDGICERKRERGEWTDYLMVKESNSNYGSIYPITPLLHYSNLLRSIHGN
jgi:hypothetical protein